LTRAEFAGITIVQRLPNSLHAYAMAWPKLPDDAAITWGCGTFATTLNAARNLKLPVRWKVSVARTTSSPRCAARRGASSIVVGRGASAASRALTIDGAAGSGTVVDSGIRCALFVTGSRTR
jgi:hypothetical protein